MFLFNGEESVTLGKKRRMIWQSLTLLIVCVCHTQTRGTYSVLAPSVLRPNRDFGVVVGAHKVDGPLRMGVEITGDIDSDAVPGGSFQTRQEVVLQSDSSQLVNFQMGDLSPGVYHLSVSGVAKDLEFRNITTLSFEPKSHSVFIETDRAMYKPGEEVKFRVIVVNPNLRPSVTGAIDVAVMDGSNITIKEWSRVFTVRGVWSAELKLSDEPVMGQWTITTRVLGQETKSSFFVAEFVEPKFEVSVDLPEYLSLDDETMKVTVNAHYPYGRPIKGEVTVQVTPRYKYDYLQAPYDAPVSFVKGIKGSVSIDMNLLEDLGLSGDYARELEVAAYVKEDLTERIQNSSSVVTVYRFPYKIDFIRSSDTFKPGLKYTAYLQVRYQDNRPVTSGEVFVRHAFTRDERAFVETRHEIPPSGVVTIEVFPPIQRPGPTWTLAFEARYLNLTQWLGEVQRAKSPAGVFLQSTIVTPNPTVGDEVIVALNSTEPLVYFNYEVLARGNLLYATTLQARGVNTHTFRFIASAAMYPRSRLILYSVRDDGEVVADSLHFNVQRRPKDKVVLSVSPKWVDVSGEGGTVSISISARPNSVVGVAAVDRKTLSLMGDAYRLQQDDIVREMVSYDSGLSFHQSYSPIRSKRSIETSYNWYGTSTAHDVFDNAGLVVMTNGNIYQQSDLQRGDFLPGHGPIDGRGWDPEKLPAAYNGAFGRLPTDQSNGVSILKPDLGPGVAYKAPPRPPLAGPYAFSFLPPPPDHKPRIHLSQSLPPTWLFTLRQTGLNGIISWREKLPKLPSSYVMTAFAIDDFDGLTLAETSETVTAYRPFYVSMRLPKSVYRGEAVAVELVVFNNRNRNTSATVTIHNDEGEFLFPDFSNEIDQGSPALDKSRVVTIPTKGRVPLSFMVVPQTLGTIKIRVTAKAETYSDSLTENLLVKAEGHKLHVNKALYVDSTADPNFSETVNITIPRNIVNNTLKIEVSAVGDILGPAVASLEELVKLPRGCGEQNMANMIPILVRMQHLKSVGELSRTLEEKSVAILAERLQQQYTYRQLDGSFAFFDEYRDTMGSTWLTAFVVKSLRSVSEYVDVPRDVITSALAWLVKQQEGDGSFSEANPDTFGATNESRTTPLALTSYVLLAFLEVEDYSSASVRNAGNRALEYISLVLTEGGDTDDIYGLAIATYALHLANHAHRDTAFYMLEGKAIVSDSKKHWSFSNSTPISTEEGDIVSSETLEQTAYGLMTYALRGLSVDSVEVVRWITSKRNHMGGFSTSQDTTVGLSSLAALSELLLSLVRGPLPGATLTIRVVYGERGHRFNVQKANARTLQKIELPEDTRSVELSASGDGRAVVQVSYSYNVQVTAPKPAFSLDPQLDRTTDANKLRLTACTGLLVRGNDTQSSNMAVMEVKLPSGYLIDNDALPGLYDYPDVRRVERLSGEDTGVAIYFDKLTAVEVCPTVIASRVNRVAFQKPAAVRVYDYYDFTKQARQFYKAASATLCDICDLGECDTQTCDVQIAEINRQRQSPDDIGYPATIVEETSGGSTKHWYGALSLLPLLLATLVN